MRALDEAAEFDEDTAWLFVPARQVLGPGEQVYAELRRLGNGRLALPAYTSLPELVGGCGGHQSWVSFPAAWLPRLHEEIGFDTVVLNPPLPELSRQRGTAHEWPGKPAEWDGSAAGRITSARQATALAAASSGRIRTALHTFADAMDAVRDRRRQATSIASAAGLTVSADTVRAPEPPSPPAAARYTPAGAVAAAGRFAAAEAKYRRQLAAHQRAEHLIGQARTEEEAAHQALREIAEREGGILDELADDRYWLTADSAPGVTGEGLPQAAEADDRLGLGVDSAARLAGLSLPAGAAAFGTGYAVRHHGPAAWNWTSDAAGNAVSARGSVGWTPNASYSVTSGPLNPF